MAAPAEDPKVGDSGGSAWRWARLVPPIDESPFLLKIFEKTPGRVVLALVFAVLVAGHEHPELVLAIVPAFAPKHRRLAVGLSTLALIAVGLGDRSAGLALAAFGQGAAVSPSLGPIATFVGLAITGAYVLFARSNLGAPLRRRPISTWVGGYLALIVLATFVSRGPIWVWAWSIVATIGSYLWFASYILADRTIRSRKELILDVLTMQPLWSGSHAPMPKSGIHLARIEVASTEEAARWQLKALKLLLWAALLSVALKAAQHALSGRGLVDYHDALAASRAGLPLSARAGWLSLAITFATRVTSLAINGHVIIAAARFAGFKALRNTYRPFAARTLADFWNRIYFYFKEVLVDVFFFPTFIRYFKRRSRLRLAFATFAAAGFGNFLFHWLRDVQDIATRGLGGSLVAMQTYALYCALLASGIAVSQVLAHGKPRRDPSLVERARVLGTIVVFYGLLTVLDEAGKDATIGDCARFALHLVPGLRS